MTKKSRRRRKTKSQNSAGDSSCCSSQELSPDEHQPPFHSKYLEASPSSQETYCSEIERIVDGTHSKTKFFESNYPNSQDSVYPNSQEFSQTSSLIASADLMGKICSNGTAIHVQQTSSMSSQCSTEPIDATKLTDSSDAIGRPVVAGCSSDDSKTKSRKRKASYKATIQSDSDDTDLDVTTTTTKHRKLEDPSDDKSYGMCGICLTQPKNAAFLHNRFIHIYACYRCSVKIWNKRKRCPICNLQVKTVLKFSVY